MVGGERMIQLIKFEIYKIMKQKVLWGALVVTLFLAIYFSLQMIGGEIAHLYKPWEGPISESKFKRAHIEDEKLVKKQESRELSQEEMFQRTVYGDIFYAEHFVKLQPEKIKNAQTKSIAANSNYQKEKYILEANMLKNIKYNTIEYQRPLEQSVKFLGTGSLAILAVLIILGVSINYSNEYATGVASYLFTSVYGRKKLLTAKLFATWIIVGIVTLLSTLLPTLFWIIYDDNSGWNSPLQSVDRFYESPYAWTIGEYLLIALAFQILVAISLSTLALLISTLCKSVLASVIITTGVIGIPYLFEIVIPATFFPDWFPNAIRFTHGQALNAYTLFAKFETINLFGTPILLPVAVGIFMAILIPIMIFYLYKIIKHKELT